MENSEPAYSILKKLGGPAKVAAYLGIHVSRPFKWYRPKDAGGTDGKIPHEHERAIMKMARERDEVVKYDDFVLEESEHLGF